MMLLLLQKWVKSIQCKLNSFFDQLNDKIEKGVEYTSSSAFTLARKNISHTGFIEMTQKISNDFYNPNENQEWFQTWEWYTVCAVDGSKIRLPNNDKIKKEFWEIQNMNQTGKLPSYAWCTLSVMYDVCNRIAIDSILDSKGNERALLEQHFENIKDYTIKKTKILLLLDRWYPWKEMFWEILENNIDFVVRLSSWHRFGGMNELFEKDCQIQEKTIDIQISKSGKDTRSIKLRFVRVVLKTGEIEILATSLLDNERYKVENFKDLYFLRWGIETYYDVLKNNLSLENFTWTSPESVKQDIFSSIFLSNMESIMTKEMNEKMAKESKEKNLKHTKKVNKSVAIHTLKNNVIDLFLMDIPVKELYKKLYSAFWLSSNRERKWRSAPRDKTTTWKSLDYHKRRKKHNF